MEKDTQSGNAKMASMDHCVQLEPLPSTKVSHHHTSPMCRRSTKIAVAISLLATLVAAASVTAALYYFGNAHVYLNDKRTLFRSASSQVEQETHIDSNKNFIKYSIRTSEEHTTEVLVDTNMALQIYKVSSQDEVSCYLTPIIISFSSSFSSSSDPPTSIYSDTNSLNLTRVNRQTILHTSSQPIVDKHILGERGRAFCNTEKVYWSLQQPENQQQQNTSNQQQQNQQLKNQKNLPQKHGASAISPSNNSSNNPSNKPSNKPSNNSSNNLSNKPSNKPSNKTSNKLPPNNETPLIRLKRQSTWMYVCLWDWSNCYYFTFPDDRTNFRYYRCKIKCQYIDTRMIYNIR